MTAGPLAISFTAFVRDVLRVVLTLGQRVIARIAYDGDDPDELAGDERDRAREIFGDVDAIPSMSRAVFVAVCGARSGKSYALGALRLLHLALTVPLTTLAPGEMAAAILVAPDLRLARQTLRFVLGAAKSVPAIAKRIVSETADGFILRRPDGALVSVEALPATRGGSALRGRSLVCALLDEAAFFRDAESGVINDGEILKSVAPRIMPGGQILVLSTPWLETGILFDLHRQNFGSPTTALVAHAPTRLMRDDRHTLDFVDREYMRDSESSEREYGARFLSGGAASFIDPISIGHAIDPNRPLVTLAPAGTARGFGADLGLQVNSSALVGVARVGNVFEVLEVLEVRPTKGNPLKLSAVIGEHFAPMLRRHGADSFWADGHVREPAREWTSASKLRIVEAPHGAEGKAETHLLVQQAFREGRMRMARYPRLEAQLRAIISRPLPGGGLRISTPTARDGSHGDVASAFVLAVWAASRATRPGSGPAHFTPSGGGGSRYSEMGDGGRGFG